MEKKSEKVSAKQIKVCEYSNCFSVTVINRTSRSTFWEEEIDWLTQATVEESKDRDLEPDTETETIKE